MARLYFGGRLSSVFGCFQAFDPFRSDDDRQLIRPAAFTGKHVSLFFGSRSVCDLGARATIARPTLSPCNRIAARTARISCPKLLQPFDPSWSAQRLKAPKIVRKAAARIHNRQIFLARKPPWCLFAYLQKMSSFIKGPS